MENIDVLHTIMDAEKRAREIHADAEKRQSGLAGSIEAKKEELRAKYTAESERLISEARDAEKKRADDSIAALDAELQKKEASLTAAFDKNRSEWTKKLFDIVVGV